MMHDHRPTEIALGAIVSENVERIMQMVIRYLNHEITAPILRDEIKDALHGAQAREIEVLRRYLRSIEKERAS